ncbi:AGAP007876-PA, partial [Anopheles gambiae str. PEST]
NQYCVEIFKGKNNLFRGPEWTLFSSNRATSPNEPNRFRLVFEAVPPQILFRHGILVIHWTQHMRSSTAESTTHQGRECIRQTTVRLIAAQPVHNISPGRSHVIVRQVTKNNYRNSASCKQL